jgi:hypothetical protein
MEPEFRKMPPLDPMLNHLNSGDTLKPYLLKTEFNSFPSMTWSSLQVFQQNYARI